MPVVTVEEFKQIFPRLKCAGDPAIEFWLNQAEQQHPLEVWRDRQRSGILYLTAHYLDLQMLQTTDMVNIGATMGAGKGAARFAQVSELSHLEQTQFGKLWKELRDQLPIVGMAIWGGGV